LFLKALKVKERKPSARLLLWKSLRLFSHQCCISALTLLCTTLAQLSKLPRLHTHCPG
jgi:hypothetical protein